MHAVVMIDRIKIRGARVHNLKGVDVDIPLNSETSKNVNPCNGILTV